MRAIYHKLDICRPLNMRERTFAPETLRVALMQFRNGQSFHVHELATAMGLPGSWTYPACTLLQRLKYDQAAVKVAYATWQLIAVPANRKENHGLRCQ